jgi:hypothetical protein
MTTWWKHNLSRRNLLVIYVMAACVAIPSLCFADDYDDAKSLAEGFIGEYETMRSLDKTELQSLVKALCAADDSQFESVREDVGNRVRDDVEKMYETMDHDQDAANKALDKIIADDNFQDKHSEAQSLKDEVNEKWGRVQGMTDGIRAGNHPVVAYMREAGQKAHQAYQDSHSSLCTVREQPVKDNKADCISADQCWVIELKPNNDGAVNLGRAAAQKEAEALNTDFDEFRKLVDASSSFKNQCWRDKRFAPKVATYVFCPEIDDDGNYISTSYGWGDPKD